MDNIEQVGVKGGGSNPGDELGGNGWDGNYWSDYVGYDTATAGSDNTDQADGIGDLPYRSDRLFENLADRYPALQVFYFSPAEQAVEFGRQGLPSHQAQAQADGRLHRSWPPSCPTPCPTPPSQITDWVGWPQACSWPQQVYFLAQSLNLPTRPNPPGKSTNQPINHLTDHPMITVKNLTKRYPRPGRSWWSDDTITAVDDLSFELAEGGALALWGVNGAGKTTVLKCLLGLLALPG